MSDLTYSNYFSKLVEQLPEFREYYEEHLKDYDELLNYLLMDDFRRYVQERCLQLQEINNDDVIIKILKILEEGMKSPDKKLQELISIGFLESLYLDCTYEKYPYQTIYLRLKSLMEPELLSELKGWEDFYIERQ